MKLVAFLLRSSLGTVSLAVLAGIVAGISNTGLLIIINSALSKSGTPQNTLIWSFAALCLAMLVSGYHLSCLHLLIFVLIGLLIFALPVLQPTAAATTIGYSLVILYLMPPLEVIMNALPTLGRANVALQKIEAMGLSLAATSVEPSTAVSSQSNSYQSLQLEGVTHTYDSEDGFKVGPVDLSFQPAELKAREKTVVVISHDDRYFHVADRILKLNYGKMEQEIVSPLKASVVSTV